MAKRDVTEPVFSPLPDSLLITRLARELGYAVGEIARRPFAYLRDALLPDSITRSLPGRLAREVGGAASALLRHPFSFVAGALSPDAIGVKRWRRVVRLL